MRTIANRHYNNKVLAGKTILTSIKDTCIDPASVHAKFYPVVHSISTSIVVGAWHTALEQVQQLQTYHMVVFVVVAVVVRRA